MSEGMHVFKGSSPFPPPVPRMAGDIVQDSGLEASFPRNRFELGWCALLRGRKASRTCRAPPKHQQAQGRGGPSRMTVHAPPPTMYPGAGHLHPAPRYSLDTCRRILLDRAVPNLLRAKHWYSPSYSSGRPPLRKSITRVPDRLLIDTRGSLATLKNLLFRVQWKLWTMEVEEDGGEAGAANSNRVGSGLQVTISGP